MAELRDPINALAHTKAVVTDKGRQLTAWEMHLYSLLVVRDMSDNMGCGIRSQSRIAIVEPNRLETVVAIWGVIRAGGIACLMNTRMPPETLAAQAKMIGCSARLVFPDSPYSDILPDLPKLLSRPLHQDHGETYHGIQFFEPNHPATIMFTSGSSAKPKAVLHSFGNHYYSALGSNKNIPVVPGDRWLVSLPLYHVGGLAILFRCWLGGATAVLAEPGGDIVDQLSRNETTHVSLVATQLRRLLQVTKSEGRSFPRLKCVLLGGGPTPERLVNEAIDAGLPIYRSYGLTEMASQVSTSTRPDGTKRRILDYRQAKTSDDGEILVRGKTRFLGYYESNKLIQPFDPEGWFATGDTGEIDDNEGLRVTGRTDNMFVSGGENIQPEQIESVLRELAEIEEAVVVPVEDAEFGQRPLAFICGTTDYDYVRLSGLLRERLPGYAVPVEFRPWPDGYQQPGIKPNRKFLREEAARTNNRDR